MAEKKQIKTALVSVFHKDGLDELLKKLNEEGVKFLSTGGTQKFIESLGYECQKVEDVTTYPSILGGRVKTLHPKVFGGILGRRDNEGDQEQMKQYDIPEIDLVIVDLYPFEDTVASGASVPEQRISRMLLSCPVRLSTACCSTSSTRRVPLPTSRTARCLPSVPSV